MPEAWTRSEEVVWQELEGEAVLVSPRLGYSWVLNATAAYLWRHCDGRTSLQALARRVADAAGLEVRQVLARLTEFSQELAKQGLLVPAAAAGATAAPLSGTSLALLRTKGWDPNVRVKEQLAQPKKPKPRGFSTP